MLVGRKGIFTALILGAVSAGLAEAQAQTQEPAPSANQTAADAVARTLRESRSLAGYRIAIETRDGLVTLTGQVATPAQKGEAIARAGQAPGVTGVIDRLTVKGNDRVLPAQYQMARGFGRHHGGGAGAMADDEVVFDGAPAPGAAGGAEGMATGPLPEGPALQSGAMRTAAVPYPNYAWPSYAPYPNFSAVGYPLIYPWQAWPNIGPFYPYPEAPLDWRAVTANYHDGVWHVKFRKNYTRPFIMVWPFADIFNRNY
jgi:hypothetical protein